MLEGDNLPDSINLCETIIDQIKNIFLIEYSRNRSTINFLTNLFSALIAYAIGQSGQAVPYWHAFATTSVKKKS